MADFSENLEKLRKSFITGKNSKETNIDNFKQIKEWEDKYENLNLKKIWTTYPETRKLKNVAVAQVREINGRLANEKNMEQRERDNLFMLKDAHLIYIALLADNIDEEKTALEQEVESRSNE